VRRHFVAAANGQFLDKDPIERVGQRAGGHPDIIHNGVFRPVDADFFRVVKEHAGDSLGVSQFPLLRRKIIIHEFSVHFPGRFDNMQILGEQAPHAQAPFGEALFIRAGLQHKSAFNHLGFRRGIRQRVRHQKRFMLLYPDVPRSCVMPSLFHVLERVRPEQHGSQA